MTQNLVDARANIFVCHIFYLLEDIKLCDLFYFLTLLLMILPLCMQERACEHVKESPSMFAAKQCIGERGQYGTTTDEMCFPSTDTVVSQVLIWCY